MSQHVPSILSIARPANKNGTSMQYVGDLAQNLTAELAEVIAGRLGGESPEAIFSALALSITELIQILDFGCDDTKSLGTIGQTIVGLLNDHQPIAA